MGVIPDTSNRISGDQKLFVGRNHECMQPGIIRADLAFDSSHLVVYIVVEAKSRPLETFADLGSDLGLVLSDPSGEDNRVSTAHTGEKSANVFSCAITKHLNSQPHPVLFLIFRFLLQYAHVVRQSRDAQQS